MVMFMIRMILRSFGLGTKLCPMIITSRLTFILKPMVADGRAPCPLAKGIRKLMCPPTASWLGSQETVRHHHHCHDVSPPAKKLRIFIMHGKGGIKRSIGLTVVMTGPWLERYDCLSPHHPL
jgi:hypothetical protein